MEDAPAPQGYTVKPGDTLYSVAFRYQVDYRDLAFWNGIQEPYSIAPGRRLILKDASLRPVPAAPVRSEPTIVAKAPASRRPQSSVSRRPVNTSSPKPASKPVAKPRPKPVSRPTPNKPATRTRVAQPTGPLPKLGQWNWPVRGSLGRTFDSKKGIKGIDILGDQGTRIVAAAPGKVVYSGSALKGYGKLLIIKHSDQYLSAYGHNQRLLVREGASVKGGQPIAQMGLGPSRQALLHFEIRKKGKPVNPLKFLPGRSG